MIKLYVIVVGLFAIVPPKTPNGPVSVLLVRSDQALTSTSGSHIPAHHAVAYFRPKGYAEDETARWSFNGDNVEFGLVANPTTFLPADFVEIKNIVEKDVKLLAGCNDPSHSSSCQVEGLPALIGRIVFRGGAISPLNVRDRNVTTGDILIDKGPSDIYEFRSLAPSGLVSKHVKAAPTGMVYSTMVDPARAEITLLGQRVPLDIARPQNCLELGADSACIIIKIMNSSIPDPGHAEGAIQPFPSETPDAHFEPFYKLLSDRNVVRFLPHRRLRPTKKKADPPESRCIIPVIEEP